MFYSLISQMSLLSQSVFIFCFCLLVSSIIAPILVHYLRKRKIGQTVRELGPQSHFHKSGTPTMGGFIFVLPPILASLLFMPIYNPHLIIIVIGFAGLALLGFMDDFLKLVKKNHLGVSPKYKIIYQIIIGILIGIGVYTTVGSYLYLPFKYSPILNLKYFIILFSILLIISWSNALNLTDGLDGLAGGLSILACIPLIIFGFIQSTHSTVHTFLPTITDSFLVSLFLLGFVASLLVFMWFNSAPAQIFMGDTGSLAIGGLFAMCSLLLHVEFFFAYIGCLFILENLSVIIQVIYYKKTKKRFFKMAPLHHHFEQKGIPETKIVLRSWMIQILLIITSLLILFYK